MNTSTPYTHDAIILGAGASGLMAAYVASGRGIRCVLVDQATSIKDIAPKLCIAGGGMGNVTNLSVSSKNYMGRDAVSFTKRALQHTSPPWILERLQDWQIPFEERTDGQIFCTVPAKHLMKALVENCQQQGVELLLGHLVTQGAITRPNDNTFLLRTDTHSYSAPQLIIALGSTAWPSARSTSVGLQIAKNLGHTIIPPRPALVPLIMPHTWPFQDLQGISLDVHITTIDAKKHHGALLFTHKGISGPAVLRASTRWQKQEPLRINWLPDTPMQDYMHDPAHGSLTVMGFYKRHLPTRFAERLYATLPPEATPNPNARIAEIPKKIRQTLAEHTHNFLVIPKETAGLQKAEAMAGGVATEHISSKTMESKLCNGLFILGECLDVLGDLGGYNLHWAFASARSSGNALTRASF